MFQRPFVVTDALTGTCDVSFDIEHRRLCLKTQYQKNKEVAAKLVSTIDTDNVKSQNQDKEDNPEYQKLPILLILNGVKTSTNAQNAHVEQSLLCAGGMHELDP